MKDFYATQNFHRASQCGKLQSEFCLKMTKIWFINNQNNLLTLLSALIEVIMLHLQGCDVIPGGFTVVVGGY